VLGADRSGSWSDAAASAAVRSVLETNRRLRAIHPVGVVGSTQDIARSLAENGAPDGTVVVADQQTAGRGRRGRRWEDDPSGGGLALTLLLDEERTGTATMLVPHALGVAVRDACLPHVTASGSLGLKWPNDVVFRADPRSVPRKLAGVLVERELATEPSPREVLLCGVGLNVELHGTASDDRIDLAGLAMRAPDRGALLAALLAALDRSLVLLADAPDELIARYRGVCDTIGRDITVVGVGDEAVDGTAVDVDDEGRLIVSTDGAMRAILSGTIRDREESP
jgi:BirA family biotin operon repressor/biotin-[acetyl-CoA-carboxylase] ligase